MVKKALRIISLILVVLFATLSNASVFAVEPRATNYIEVQGGSIGVSGKELTVDYTVTGGTILDQIGVYYISIQRSTDQQSWSTEKALYYFDYTEFVAENTYDHAGEVSYTGTRGYYYRARIEFFAKIDGNSERTSMYTNTVYIPPSGNGGRIAG